VFLVDLEVLENLVILVFQMILEHLGMVMVYYRKVNLAILELLGVLEFLVILMRLGH